MFQYKGETAVTLPRRPVAGMLLWLLISAGLSAETYTLGRALQAAREADAVLEQASRSLAQARIEERSSWNLFLPELSAGVTVGRDVFTEGRRDPSQVALSAGASLGIGSAVDRRIESRTLTREAAVLELERRRVALEEEVKRRFYTVLLTERRISIAERNLTLAEQQLARVRARYESGRASELELLEARAAAINRRPVVLSRREELERERAALRELLGLKPDVPLTLDGEISVPEVEMEAEAIRHALRAGAPELHAARLSLRRAENAQTVSFRDNKLPRLSASYSYSPSFSPAFEAASYRDAEPWQSGRVSVRLTVPLDPLVPRSQADNRVRAARTDVERARLQFEETVAGLEHLAAERAKQLDVARKRLLLREEAVEVARQRFEATRGAYDSGGVDLLDVEDARRALEEAELSLLEERYSILLTLVELDAAAGGGILSE